MRGEKACFARDFLFIDGKIVRFSCLSRNFRRFRRDLEPLVGDFQQIKNPPLHFLKEIKRFAAFFATVKGNQAFSSNLQILVIFFSIKKTTSFSFALFEIVLSHIKQYQKEEVRNSNSLKRKKFLKTTHSLLSNLSTFKNNHVI